MRRTRVLNGGLSINRIGDVQSKRCHDCWNAILEFGLRGDVLMEVRAR